ncbi:MAG: ribonuclease Y [Sulfuricurvum sp. GWF2_44_89]|uniref:Ribonuclease Y n=1 Tax=Sulfuricurvum kujiense TaxID=148813 RepID=A0A2D3WIN4_9BACT|nr:MULTISPECIES: ribonuclease Y [Sulfuricurvum]OHD78996.1 MAG: ribonuclease Y [Sulfuricurvum sp. GWF2_44_89]OHD93602.1 MAG: ribonuclease Y [Sulfuricurvum sp. RIFOXYD12_FULL_44_77]OHD97819.1 MAG: ribonuclease Y [Sulfuricurvum sp. RIFOXYD2_FULL_44_160]DAB38910.1 MAG TPA: ribonuclease Y [Sulfuricurvum kujiense]
MLNELLVGGAVALISGLVGFLISKKITASHFDLYLEQAKAKSKAIENEAHLILERASLRSREIEKEAQKRYDETSEQVKKDFSLREEKMERAEREFEVLRHSEEEKIAHERNTIENRRLNLERNERALEKLKEDYRQKSEQLKVIVEQRSGLSVNEAKMILLDQIRENERLDLARELRKLEEQSKELLKRKANYILAQATSRFAGEYAAERLISVIHLDDDELKGRIIGKEGRNIKTLEMVSGVDIIIDETPNAIIVSSFNLYRRAIATKTIELLIQDGRIQPARIEEVYQKVCDEFEEATTREGEEIIFELGLQGVHPELMKLIGRLKYRSSYGQNALAHTLEVAHLAGIMASEMGGDIKLARRAGLLHDIGKTLTQDNGGNHVDIGAELCRRYSEDPVVINAIYAHHGHEEIKSIECAAVCAADTLSAARPGARREVLESFLRRVSEIEEIATQKAGVKQAYAINAGREVRVIVSAQSVNDDETVLIAREIADEISQKVQFPGEIKVNVIRESRVIEYAR